ncbi:MAG: hypothetical protein ACE5NG_00085 [bacterium]
MKNSWLSLLMLVFLAIFLVLGCSNEPLTNSREDLEGDEELSLDKEFGGFDTSDEPVGFGEPDMVDDFPEDADVADAFSVEAETVEALNSDTVKAYFLRITWGLLEGDSTATEVIDWSGSAEINKGTLVLLKTIRFERNDFIHLPRESRQKVDFTSFTSKHLDGIAIAIIDNDTTQEDLEGTFTLNAGNYSKVLAFSELDSLELVESVGSGGHEVSIISRSKEVVPFAGGFLSGHWVKTRPDGGIFRGRWINSLGTNAGHLKGIWGINRRGRKVFFGKWISLNGQFRGLLEGRWQFTRGENRGVFHGRWVNRAFTTGGTLKGHFKTGRPGDRRGFFHGRWRVKRPRDGENS